VRWSERTHLTRSPAEEGQRRLVCHSSRDLAAIPPVVDMLRIGSIARLHTSLTFARSGLHSCPRHHFPLSGVGHRAVTTMPTRQCRRPRIVRSMVAVTPIRRDTIRPQLGLGLGVGARACEGGLRRDGATTGRARRPGAVVHRAAGYGQRTTAAGRCPRHGRSRPRDTPPGP
jgi:hypothetical protein